MLVIQFCYVKIVFPLLKYFELELTTLQPSLQIFFIHHLRCMCSLKPKHSLLVVMCVLCMLILKHWRYLFCVIHGCEGSSVLWSTCGGQRTGLELIVFYLVEAGISHFLPTYALQAF